MFAAQSAMTAVSVALAAVAFLRRDSVAVIYVLNAVQACATSFDNPARQALIPRLVPLADLPGALALNVTMFQAATIAGPALAGALLAELSGLPAFAGAAGSSAVGVIYALNAV